MAGVFAAALPAYAHEAYVLPQDTFWNNLHSVSNLSLLAPLHDPENLATTIYIVLGVTLALLLNFFFRRSNLGKKVSNYIEKFSHLGHHFVRISLALALFFSAQSFSFLGPELSLSALPYGEVIQATLYILSILVLVGALSELVGFIGLLLFVVAGIHFGEYVFTYTNYVGEFLVLLLFGMRSLSVDKYLFGPLKRFKNFRKYETLIIRLLYGSALIYAAITVKLLHPELTLYVVENWNLTQFTWLFPPDPALVAFGAGIVEIIIGLFIIIGFEMRLTILVSLFYITLSLIFFREMVWPHLMLYGISLSLFVQKEFFTVDHFLFYEHHKKKHTLWKRPLLSTQRSEK